MSPKASCFECGSEIVVAIYQDAEFVGEYIPICTSCRKNVPEDNLWRAGDIENTDDVFGPHNSEDHPIPEGEEWVVVEREYNPVREQTDTSKQNIYEIYLRDETNSKALTAARDKVRETKQTED